MKTGLGIIAEARQKQFDKGHTIAKDLKLRSGELAMMAACYSAPDKIYAEAPCEDGMCFKDPFPRDKKQDARRRHAMNEHGSNSIRPTTPMYRSNKEAIEMLGNAGALIAAEIDRILNLPPSSY